MATKSLSATIFGVDEASPVFKTVGKNADKMAGDTEQAGSRMGAAFKKGATMAAGALAAVGFTEFVKGTIQEASNLEQNVGAMEAVFGKAADSIRSFGETSASTVGIAKQDYYQLAAVFGAQLKNMGVAANELAPKTNQLVTLGSDLAAVYGGTASEAVEAISSLLRGERDPIERYGVSIKQASINAYEMSEGLDTSTAAAKTNADMQATLALLFQQTADAQGQFAIQTDTLAESQQIATAKFKEAQAEIGTKLLPIVTDLTNFAADNLVPILGVIADGVGSVVHVIDMIPGPVKASLLALVGFKVFQQTAVFSKLAGAARGFGEEMQVQAALARMGGQEIGKFGAAAATMRGRFGQLVSAINPWTAALVAAPFAIDLVAKAFSHAGPPAHDFTDAIDENTGALRDNWAQAIAKKLAEDGTVSRINAIGASVTDYTAALMGNNDAYMRVSDAAMKHTGAEKTGGEVLAQLYTDRKKYAEQLEHAQQAHLAATELERQASEVLATSTEVRKEATVAVDEHAAALSMQAQAANLAGQAQREYQAKLAQQQAFREASDNVLALAKSYEEGYQKAHDLTSATDQLSAMLDKLAGREPSVEEAQRRFNGVLGDASSALKLAKEDTGSYKTAIDMATGVINTSTDAGQKLYDWVTQAASAARDSATAQAELAGKIGGTDAAAKAANDTLAKQKDAFIKSATQAGVARDAAIKLADAYFGMPKQIETIIKGRADFKDVDAELQRLADTTVVVDVSGRYTHTVGAPGGISAGPNVGMASGGWVIPGAATGEWIRGGIPGRDSVLRALMPGEAVIAAQPAQANRPIVDALMAGYPVMNLLRQTSSGGGSFTGTLVLDSGQFLGTVKGVIRDVQRDDARRGRQLSRMVTVS